MFERTPGEMFAAWRRALAVEGVVPVYLSPYEAAMREVYVAPLLDALGAGKSVPFIGAPYVSRVLRHGR